jgi:hypothetical protein
MLEDFLLDPWAAVLPPERTKGFTDSVSFFQVVGDEKRDALVGGKSFNQLLF